MVFFIGISAMEVDAMKISSPAFVHGGEIPMIYTCEGDNISPPLRWQDIPAGAKSLVLIVDDPDAPDPANPRMTWVHWVLYDLPPACKGLDQGAGNREGALPPGTGNGLNDWGRVGYGGPCPPIGTHRYFFKLYALDTVLQFSEPPVKAQVESAMQGHVMEKAVLMGRYHKQGRAK